MEGLKVAYLKLWTEIMYNHKQVLKNIDPSLQKENLDHSTPEAASYPIFDAVSMDLWTTNLSIYIFFNNSQYHTI